MKVSLPSPLLYSLLLSPLLLPFSPAQSAGPGVSATATALAGGQCLEVLPDGSYYHYDGVAIHYTKGAQTHKVFTPSGTPFGSFIKQVPGKAAILFGESSGGTITEIGTGALPYFRLVARITFNYDCSFGPRGELLISAPLGTTGTNAIYLVDSKGGTDTLLSLAGASGPLTVLPGGDLLVGQISSTYPPPPKSARILRYPYARWLSARGPGNLTAKDGTLVLGNLDGVYDLVAHDQGSITFTDPVSRVITTWAGQGRHTLYQAGKETPTQLGSVPGPGPATFHPYQPAGGGEMLALTSDFFSTTNLVRLRPTRPTFTASPMMVPPRSSVTCTVTAGPPGGSAFLFFSTGCTRPEVVYSGLGLDFPLFLGLTPGGLLSLAVPLTLDQSGAAKVGLPWAGGTGATIHLQPLLAGTKGLVGSAPPLTLTLQP